MQAGAFWAWTRKQGPWDTRVGAAATVTVLVYVTEDGKQSCVEPGLVKKVELIR
jgi:hypothetical protein